MTPTQADHAEQAVRRAAVALAVVLDLRADDLRADSPLADLGADSVALVQWADVAEDLAREDGRSAVIDDDALAAARTLGDLADHLAAVTR